jgi:hypothetical protein
MDVMADVLYELSTNEKDKNLKEEKLRVPLSCLVDYKGFRCLAIAKISIVGTLPELGFYQGSYLPTDRSNEGGLLVAF